MNDVIETTDSKSVDAIAELAVAANEVEALEAGDIATAVTPSGYKRETLDLEKFLDAPRRATGQINAFTLDDLIRYTKRHDHTETTTLWLSPEAEKIIAVLNDHALGDFSKEITPNWGDWRAELALRKTPEWKLLMAANEKQMPQYQFAELVEDLTHIIEEPDAADLFEMAQTFHAHRTADFSQIQRLSNGQISVQYNEEIEAHSTDSKGRVSVPEIIVFKVAPFEGEDPATIKAFLRYRLDGPKLTLGIKLDRPEDHVRECFERMQTRLGEEFSAERVFLGSPRS
jgi:uncharacterized protein YfdQ (DUF2303 family)